MGCQYTFTTGTDPIVPGTTDTGNHIDDGDTFVALPFSFSLYDQTYNGVNVSSNGRLDFVCINEPGGYMSACLPPPANQCPFDYTIFAWSTFAPVYRRRLRKLRIWLRYLYFGVGHCTESHL